MTISIYTLQCPKSCSQSWKKFIKEHKEIANVIEKDMIPVINKIDNANLTEGFTDTLMNMVSGKLSGSIISNITTKIMDFAGDQDGTLFEILAGIFKNVVGELKEHKWLYMIGVVVLKQFLGWKSVAGIIMAIVAAMVLIKWAKGGADQAKEKGQLLAKAATTQQSAIQNNVDKGSQNSDMETKVSDMTAADAKKVQPAEEVGEQYCRKAFGKTLNETRNDFIKKYGKHIGKQRFETIMRIAKNKI